MAIFFQLDFPVYFVTRGSKLIIDLIFTFRCDFYKILNNIFDQYSLFHEFTFLAIFFGSLLGRSVLLKKFVKNAASAATFKFWGVYVPGHIFLGRLPDILFFVFFKNKSPPISGGSKPFDLTVGLG